MVGQGDAVHPQFNGTINNVLRRRKTIKKTELGMDMQMNEVMHTYIPSRQIQTHRLSEV